MSFGEYRVSIQRYPLTMKTTTMGSCSGCTRSHCLYVGPWYSPSVTGKEETQMSLSGVVLPRTWRSKNTCLQPLRADRCVVLFCSRKRRLSHPSIFVYRSTSVPGTDSISHGPERSDSTSRHATSSSRIAFSVPDLSQWTTLFVASDCCPQRATISQGVAITSSTMTTTEIGCKADFFSRFVEMNTVR